MAEMIEAFRSYWIYLEHNPVPVAVLTAVIVLAAIFFYISVRTKQLDGTVRADTGQTGVIADETTAVFDEDTMRRTMILDQKAGRLFEEIVWESPPCLDRSYNSERVYAMKRMKGSKELVAIVPEDTLRATPEDLFGALRDNEALELFALPRSMFATLGMIGMYLTIGGLVILLISMRG